MERVEGRMKTPVMVEVRNRVQGRAAEQIMTRVWFQLKDVMANQVWREVDPVRSSLHKQITEDFNGKR